MRFISEIRKFLNDLLTQPRYLLALRFTLVVLLLYGGGDSQVLTLLLRTLSGIMLVFTPLTTSRIMWMLVSVLLIIHNSIFWLTVGNHQYLYTYWCIACTFVVFSKDPEYFLSVNARLLIGFTFFFATLWKLTSGEFVDGSLIHYYLLTDYRLETLPMFFGNLGQEILAQNRMLNRAIVSAPQEVVSIALNTSPGVLILSKLMTYWTLLIEGSITFVFLFTWPRWAHDKRDIVFIVFILTTFFLLPVPTLSSILTLLGFAQCPLEKKKTLIAYILLFPLVQLFNIQNFLPHILRTFSHSLISLFV